MRRLGSARKRQPAPVPVVRRRVPAARPPARSLPGTNPAARSRAGARNGPGRRGEEARVGRCRCRRSTPLTQWDNFFAPASCSIRNARRTCPGTRAPAAKGAPSRPSCSAIGCVRTPQMGGASSQRVFGLLEARGEGRGSEARGCLRQRAALGGRQRAVSSRW